MKNLLRIAIVLLIVCPVIICSLQAQTLPTNFNYQGRLTDTAGTPMPNGTYQMVFSIWDAATGGNQLWGSGNKSVVLAKGLFTTSLGPIPSAALPGSSAFLQVQLGTDTPMPRIALGAVPYALRAVELLWPAVASISSGNPVLSLTNTGAGPAISAVSEGTGRAGYFSIRNPNNSTSALLASTLGSGAALNASSSGSGAAAKIETTGASTATSLVVNNTANGGAAYFQNWAGNGINLTSHTAGNGAAGLFEIAKDTNTSPSLHATTIGSGPAIKATPGTGLAGLFEGVIQTNGFKMATGATNGYVLGSDASGSASWRKDGLALPYAIITSTAGDSFSLKNQGAGKAMWLGIDNINSTSPTLHVAGNHKGPGLLVDGLAQIGSFKMATGAGNGYVLTSDANGAGIWKAASSSFTDLSATGTISTLNLNVDPGSVNTGALSVGGIRFGTSSGEGIFSKRDAGGNRYGIDLATNSTPRLSITHDGDVGIGINPPLYKFHVKGARNGGYALPLAYIENTNNTENSSPALRLGGSGKSVDGVLNVSNFGTGKIAVFGGVGGEVANIDVDGNLSARNLSAVACVEHNNKVIWNAGDTKYLESLPVKAPSNGYYIVDAYITGGAHTTDSDKAVFELILYDATDSNNKVFLKRTLHSQDGTVRIEQDVAVRGVYPATKGKAMTFQLEGHYFDGSRPFMYWTDFTSLRVLFVPNALGQ